MKSIEAVKAVFEPLAGHIGYLSERWRDEEMYEDFAEYKASAKKALLFRLPEAQFINLTKSPFAMHFLIGEDRFTIKRVRDSMVLDFLKAAT